MGALWLAVLVDQHRLEAVRAVVLVPRVVDPAREHHRAVRVAHLERDPRVLRVQGAAREAVAGAEVPDDDVERGRVARSQRRAVRGEEAPLASRRRRDVDPRRVAKPRPPRGELRWTARRHRRLPTRHAVAVHAAARVRGEVAPAHALERHVTALAGRGLHRLVEAARRAARVSRSAEGREIVDAAEVVRVPHVCAEETAVTAAAERRGAEGLGGERRDVRLDLARVGRVGEGDGPRGQGVAPVPVGPRLSRPVAHHARDPGVRARVVGLDLRLHRARHEQHRVVAARAEPALFGADVLPDRVDGLAIPGVVERRARVRARLPRGQRVRVTAAAGVDVGEAGGVPRVVGREPHL